MVFIKVPITYENTRIRWFSRQYQLLCFFFLSVFLVALGLHWCTWPFSSHGRWGLLSNCGVWPSHCGGFYSPRAQALDPWSWVVVVHRLSCPMGCGILLDQGSSPCPLHWQRDSKPLDTRELLCYSFNYSQGCSLHSAVLNAYQRSLCILSLNFIQEHSLVMQ